MAFADKPREAVERVTDAAKRAVSSDGPDRDDNLGPDRGTMDQLEARKERARKEAREEAKKEARQERLKEEREKEKKQTKKEFKQNLDQEDRSTLKRLGQALTVDYDGDGESLAGEAGLQTEAESQRDNRRTAQAIADTRRGVINNRSAIEQVRDDMQAAHSRDRRDFEPMGVGPSNQSRDEPAGPPEMEPRSGMVPTVEEFEEQASTPASGGFAFDVSQDDWRTF